MHILIIIISLFFCNFLSAMQSGKKVYQPKTLKESAADKLIKEFRIFPLSCPNDIKEYLVYRKYYSNTNGRMAIDNVLYGAVLNDMDSIVPRLIQQGANVNATGKGWPTCIEDEPAIHAAAYNGNITILQLLLDHKAEIDNPGLYGYGITALAHAAQFGRVEAVKLLLSRGAKVDGNFGKIEMAYTPLMFACNKGQLEAVQILLAAGASINVINCHGGTALRAAVYGRHFNVIKLLISHGANPNGFLYPYQYNYDRDHNPLMSAAYSGQVEVVKILLAAGACKLVTDKQGRTPLDLAREHANYNYQSEEQKKNYQIIINELSRKEIAHHQFQGVVFKYKEVEKALNKWKLVNGSWINGAKSS